MEKRSVLAGNVTVALSAGSVVITGDAADNSIQIDASPTTPGQVTISSLPLAEDDFTTINGGSGPVTLTVANDLRVLLAGGQDNLQIRGDVGASLPRDLVVDLGDGHNNFGFLGDYQITRDFKYTSTAGFDDIEIGFVSARDFIFTTGDGGSRLDLYGLALSRNLKLTVGAVGVEPLDSENSITLTGSTIAGAINVVDGAGQSGLLIRDTAVTTNVTVTQASGAASIDLGATHSAVIHGNLVLTAQNVDAGNNFSVRGGQIQGSLLANGGAGESFLNLQNIAVTNDVRVTFPGLTSSTSLFGGTIGGKVIATQGSGDVGSFAGVLLEAGSIGGNVTISGNAEQSAVQMGNSGLLTVGGNVSVTSTGNGLTFATQTTVTGDFKVFGGAGNDIVILDGLAARDVVLNVGNGGSSLTLSHVAAVRDLTIVQGDDGFDLVDPVEAEGEEDEGVIEVGRNLIVGITSSTAGRNLSVTSGNLSVSSGKHSSRLDLQILDTEVTALTTITSGTGDVRVKVLGGLYHGNVTINGAGQQNSVLVGQWFYNEEVDDDADPATPPILVPHTVPQAIEGTLFLNGSGGVYQLQNASLQADLRLNDSGASSYLMVYTASIAGSVLATLGGGGSCSAFLSDASIAGNLTLTQNGVSNSVQGIGLGVGGNVSLTAHGFAAFILPRVNITGNLTVVNDGQTGVELGVPGPTLSTIGGSVSITAGSNGFVRLRNLHVTLDVLVTLGPAVVMNEISVGVVNPDNPIPVPVTIGRDFKVVAGDALDKVTIGDLSARDVSLNLAKGGSVLALSGIQASRDLIVTQGDDGLGLVDLPEEEGEEVNHDLTEAPRNIAIAISHSHVGRNLKVTSGNLTGHLDLQILDMEVTALTTITSGTGNVGVKVLGGLYHGNVTITGAGQQNTVLIGQWLYREEVDDGNPETTPIVLVHSVPQAIEGTLLLNGGGLYQVQNVTLQADLRVNDSGASSNLTVDTVSIAGNVLATLSGGSCGVIFTDGSIAGNLTLTQSGVSNYMIANGLWVNGDATLTGHGSASFTLLGTHAKNLTIANDGQTTVTLGDADAPVTVTRNLKITTFEGADSVTVDGATVQGSTLIDTGAGDDSLSIGANRPTDLSHGNVTVRVGAGQDSVTVGSSTLLSLSPAKFLFDGGTNPLDSTDPENDSIDLYFAVTPALASKVINFETITFTPPSPPEGT